MEPCYHEKDRFIAQVSLFKINFVEEMKTGGENRFLDSHFQSIYTQKEGLNQKYLPNKFSLTLHSNAFVTPSHRTTSRPPLLNVGLHLAKS